MKNLFLVCLVAFFALNASAQLCPTKKGSVQMHVAKDDKGKVTGYSQMTITDVEGSGANMTISYSTEALDKDKKSVGAAAVPFKMVIKNDIIVFDLKAMFGGIAGAKVEVTGDPIELPNKLSAGQVLKDATIVMSTKAGLMKTKTEMKITDYKCVAVESVTVPAGTFKCFKVTQTVTSTVMKQNYTVKTISWYATGVGTVKTQSFDDSGKLMATTELVQK